MKFRWEHGPGKAADQGVEMVDLSRIAQASKFESIGVDDVGLREAGLQKFDELTIEFDRKEHRGLLALFKDRLGDWTCAWADFCESSGSFPIDMSEQFVCQVHRARQHRPDGPGVF